MANSDLKTEKAQKKLDFCRKMSIIWANKEKGGLYLWKDLETIIKN